MTLKIPGLIANSKDEQHLTKAELQAKRDSYAAYMKTWKKEEDMGVPQALISSYHPDVKENQEEMLKQALTGISGSSAYNSTGVGGYVGGYDPYHLTPVPAPNPYVPDEMDLAQFVRDKYKGSPNNRGSFISNPLDQQNAASWAKHLEDMLKPKHSAFEDMLNVLFDMGEKEQVLINLGFSFFHENGEDWMQREVMGHLEKGKKKDIFEYVFLREMMIKFKNLLISKNSLKLKI